MNPIRNPNRYSKKIAPISPSQSDEASYEKKLHRAIFKMYKSYLYWIAPRYRSAVSSNVKADRVPNALALDANTPSEYRDDLFQELGRLARYWEKYFSELAELTAPYIMRRVYRYNTRIWKYRLKQSGFDIDLQLTQRQKNILAVKVKENVALIRTIPQQWHADVEGLVSRGFLAGRDLDTIAKSLRKRYGTSIRRAALIARDQCNKASAQMNAARQAELDLRYAFWKHSSAGREPRPEHVRASREGWIFDTQKGIDFGDGFGFVLPGEAINCRCRGQSIIPSVGRGVEGSRSFDPESLTPVPGFPGAYTLRR